MRLLLDVKDKKAAFVLELLKDLPYVKTTTIVPAKAELMEDLQEAVEYVNLAKKGKVKPRDVKDFLDEL